MQSGIPNDILLTIITAKPPFFRQYCFDKIEELFKKNPISTLSFHRKRVIPTTVYLKITRAYNLASVLGNVALLSQSNHPLRAQHTRRYDDTTPCHDESFKDVFQKPLQKICLRNILKGMLKLCSCKGFHPFLVPSPSYIDFSLCFVRFVQRSEKDAFIQMTITGNVREDYNKKVDYD